MDGKQGEAPPRGAHHDHIVLRVAEPSLHKRITRSAIAASHPAARALDGPTGAHCSMRFPQGSWVFSLVKKPSRDRSRTSTPSESVTKQGRRASMFLEAGRSKAPQCAGANPASSQGTHAFVMCSRSLARRPLTSCTASWVWCERTLRSRSSPMSRTTCSPLTSRSGSRP